MKASTLSRWFVFLFLLLAWSCARIPDQRENREPFFLEHLTASSSVFNPGEEVVFQVQVVDPDGDDMSSHWLFSTGTLVRTALDSAVWIAPDSSQQVRVIILVTDSQGGEAADTAYFQNQNRAPVIAAFQNTGTSVINGNTVSIWVDAADPDSQEISFSWGAETGLITETFGDSIRWQAPDSTVRTWVSVAVADDFGAVSRDTLRLNVYRELGCAWICNQDAGEVVKLSAIGSEILRSGGFTEPTAVAVDAEQRKLWVLDHGTGSLHQMDFQGAVLTTKSGFINPVALAASSRDGSCWVVDADSGDVTQISHDGYQVLCRIRGFVNPRDLAVNRLTGDVWVVDSDTGMLYRFFGELPAEMSAADSTHVQRLGGFVYPVGVTVETSTGACWVADRYAGTVIRVTEDLGEQLSVSGFESPLALDATQYEGIIWVADRSSNGKIIKLFYNDFQAVLDGLSFPTAVAVDPNSGVCWALDSERNRVLRISPSGSLLTEVSAFSFPVAVAVNTGY